MDDTAEPTVILKSLKDFNKFMSQGKRSRDSIGGQNFRLFHDSMKSPRLKLDFSDSFSNATVNDTINDSDSYLQRHRDSIVGFDITKKIREKDCEINETKAAVSVLESRMQSQQANYKKRKLDFESEVDTYRRKSLRDQEILDDLQHKVKELQMKEQESKEELLRIQKATNTKCSQMEKKMLQMQIDHAERSKKNHEEFSQLKEHAEKVEKDLQEKESLLSNLEANNKELEERCVGLHKKLATSERAQLAMESMKLKLSQTEMANKELQMRLGNVKHQETQYELFERLLKQRPVLEKDMLRLKEENNMHRLTGVNVGLVEEKLAAAESQIRRLETRCSELTAENGTLSTLREMSEQHETALMKELSLEYLPPVSELIEHIQSLKKRDTEASNSLTELRASLKSHDTTRLNNDEIVSNLELELEKCRIAVEKKDGIVRRLQRKLVLVSKERDNLKGIISSYEDENTIKPSQLEQERVSKLESMLSDYKTEILKLEEDLRQALDISGKSMSQVKASSEGISASSLSSQYERIKELEKLLSTASEEKDILEMRLEQQILKGSYDPSKTKVLHFTENPLEAANQQSQAAFDRLQQENEALKKRVKLLEEGETLNLTQKVGVQVDTDPQYHDLERRVASLETRNDRMVEAFKKKSQEMREVVWLLLGYRVDLGRDNEIKLFHVYGESRDDYLLLKRGEDGAIELLENEFSLSLKTIMVNYLHPSGSYPAFLAAVTLELYNKNTAMHSPESSNAEDEEEEEAGMEEDYGGEDEMDEEEEEPDINMQHNGHLPSGDDDDDDEEDEDDDDEEEDDLICID